MQLLHLQIKLIFCSPTLQCIIAELRRDLGLVGRLWGQQRDSKSAGETAGPVEKCQGF